MLQKPVLASSLGALSNVCIDHIMYSFFFFTFPTDKVMDILFDVYMNEDRQVKASVVRMTESTSINLKH